MPTIKHTAIRTLLLVGFIAAQTCLSHAASLRRTSGNTTVVRQAAYAEPVQEEIVLVEETVQIVGESFEVGTVCGAPPVVGCGACTPCWSDQRWVDFDYLLMFQKGRWFPPLARVSQTDVADAQVAFGNEQVGEQPHGGGRLEFGTWLDPCRMLGIGAHFVAISEAPLSLNVTTSEFAYIDRPFIDHFTGTPEPNAFVVGSVAAQTEGRLSISTNSEITGFDVFAKSLLAEFCDSRLDFVFGYVHSRIDEELLISSFTGPAGGGFPTLDVTDVFTTKNEYNAGLIGLTGEYRRGPLGLELFARFGFGTMRQTIAISGSTTSQSSTAAGDTVVTNRGFLAQPTNSEVWVQDTFSFMEDVGFKLAWHPTCRTKVSLGYTLMYWTSVARPGNHIDMNNNSAWFPQTGPAPTTPYPRFVWNPTDLFVHGLTAGVEYRF